MANMSYCRFENTARDLSDCQEALEESDGDLSELSSSEKRAALRLLKRCREIENDFGHLLDEDGEG